MKILYCVLVKKLFALKRKCYLFCYKVSSHLKSQLINFLMGDDLSRQSLLIGLTIPVIFTNLGRSRKMISFVSWFKVSDVKGWNRKWINIHTKEISYIYFQLFILPLKTFNYWGILMEHSNSWTRSISCRWSDSSSLQVHCPCEVCKGHAVHRKTEKRHYDFFSEVSLQGRFFQYCCLLIWSSKINSVIAF